MTVFSESGLAYLGERRLARLATVGIDGNPHVVPVGTWSHNAERDTIDITGRDFTRTKKFHDVEAIPTGITAGGRTRGSRRREALAPRARRSGRLAASGSSA